MRYLLLLVVLSFGVACGEPREYRAAPVPAPQVEPVKDTPQSLTPEVTEITPSVEPAKAPEKKSGFFSRVFGQRDRAPTPPEGADPSVATAAEPASPETLEAVVTPVAVESTAVDAAVAETVEAAPTPRKARLERRAERRAARQAARAKAKAEREQRRSNRSGVFAPKVPPTPLVSADSGRLPYGQFAKVCNLPTNKLGRKVHEAGGFTLYDTNFGSTKLRTHYVTGFRDKCVRKFSAALATFGDPYLHEFIHYRQRRPKLSDLDKEYEAIKARVCKAPTLKRCEKNQAELINSTTFLSLYPKFGTSGERATILLHRGYRYAEDFS